MIQPPSKVYGIRAEFFGFLIQCLDFFLPCQVQNSTTLADVLSEGPQPVILKVPAFLSVFLTLINIVFC